MESAEDHFDLIIIGAGACGIAIAREFLGRSQRVCLIESDGFKREVRNHLDSLKILSKNFVIERQIRRFGGATGIWAGRCGPFTEFDFAPRPWIKASGWPLSHEELIPYYHRAQAVFKLGAYAYDKELLDSYDQNPVTLGKDFQFRGYQYSAPAQFDDFYYEEIRKSENIEILLGHEAIQILESENKSLPGQARGVLVRDSRGEQYPVYAKQIILAAGGIENARVLLKSPSIFGTQRDAFENVGKYFQGHSVAMCAHSIGTTKAGAAVLLKYNRATTADRKIEFAINASPELQTREKILNIVAELRYFSQKPAGVQSLLELATRIIDRLIVYAPKNVRLKISHFLVSKSLHGDSASKSISALVFEIIKGWKDVFVFLTRRRTSQKLYPSIGVFLKIEQEPIPESQLRLENSETLCIDNTLSPLVQKTAIVFLEAMEKLFRENNWGKLAIDPWVYSNNTKTWRYTEGNHPMGSTRMAETAKCGVVDRDCKVFGTDNVYVAGSSIFPTCSNTNPTFTAVALALRLADYLKATRN